MKYAIVQIQGKQYTVKENDEVVVDRLDSDSAKDLTFAEVLLVRDEKNIAIGTPTVASASVLATVKDHHKGEKIRVATYKSKSRYRKVKGHRSLQTTLVIKKIKV